MRHLLLAACFLSLAFVSAPPRRPFQASTAAPAPKLKTIKQTLALIGTASTFYANLRAAKLDSMLNGSAKVQYTVFAPSNEAFIKLKEQGQSWASSTGSGTDQHQLEQLLKFHIVPGRYPTEALKAGQVLRTQHGAFNIKVSAQGTRVFVSGTNTTPVELVNAYILCENGIIHLIDEALIPFVRQKPAVSR